MDMVSGFQVFVVKLDPTQGSEIKKNRPCVIVSPDEVNSYLNTVIVAPMTTTIRNYPTRVSVTFARRKGQIALDQIRAIDKSRFVRKLGTLDQKTAQEISDVLIKMFAL